MPFSNRRHFCVQKRQSLDREVDGTADGREDKNGWNSFGRQSFQTHLFLFSCPRSNRALIHSPSLTSLSFLLLLIVSYLRSQEKGQTSCCAVSFTLGWYSPSFRCLIYDLMVSYLRSYTKGDNSFCAVSFTLGRMLCCVLYSWSFRCLFIFMTVGSCVGKVRGEGTFSPSPCCYTLEDVEEEDDRMFLSISYWEPIYFRYFHAKCCL